MDTILNPLKMTDEDLIKWIPVFKIQVESITAEMRQVEETIGKFYLYDILKGQLEEKTAQINKAESVLELREKSMR